METDDEQLVDRCVRGDASAFEELLNRYEKKVFNVALRMVNDYDDASDVTQTVFLKVFQGLKAFDTRYRFFSWIYRITLNESINLVHRRKSVRTLDERWVSNAKGPGEILTDTEEARAIRRSLMSLDLKYRAVLVLRHYLDCSYRAIGGVLQIPEKTVKSRLFTARQVLREALAGEGIPEPRWKRSSQS
jgi:RNA polymerase sigma-70 factor (ECF subfamily)